MAPRAPKGEGSSSPDQFGVPGGGSASRDHLYEIVQRVSGIERSITYIEASAQDTQKKIDIVVVELAEVKAVFNTFKPIAVNIGRALWAILGAICLFLLSILGMWMKHHFGW